mgnify:CR=1 FL=1
MGVKLIPEEGTEEGRWGLNKPRMPNFNCIQCATLDSQIIQIHCALRNERNGFRNERNGLQSCLPALLSFTIDVVPMHLADRDVVHVCFHFALLLLSLPLPVLSCDHGAGAEKDHVQRQAEVSVL